MTTDTATPKPPATLTWIQERAHRAILRYRDAARLSKRTFAADLVPSFFAAVYAVLDTQTTEDTPTAREARDWIIGCSDKRELRKGSFRWLKNSQKKWDDGTYALFSAVRWHRGNGSLWAMHPHLAARAGSLESKADTLAHALFLVTGTGSRAGAAWKRALGR
jgi:hypothetical protein